MTQKDNVPTASARTENYNISIPFGLIRTVRHYLEFIGVLPYIRGLKARGTRLDLIVAVPAVYTMHTSNSMNACAEWLGNPNVRAALGFPPKASVDQRTLNRAIEILGRNREGIITVLWRGIRECFEVDNYNLNVDGSAVVLYGPKAGLGAVGYSRDWKRGSNQVEFIVAQLAGLVASDDLHAFDGMKDPGLFDGGGDGFREIAAAVMLGAAIVADNGFASENNMKRANASRMDCVTRVKMKASDDKHILEDPAGFEYLGDGMFCRSHTFESSRRTIYLF